MVYSSLACFYFLTVSEFVIEGGGGGTSRIPAEVKTPSASALRCGASFPFLRSPDLSSAPMIECESAFLSILGASLNVLAVTNVKQKKSVAAMCEAIAITLERFVGR